MPRQVQRPERPTRLAECSVFDVNCVWAAEKDGDGYAGCFSEMPGDLGVATGVAFMWVVWAHRCK